MQKLRKKTTCPHRLLAFVVALALGAAVSGCSEYKPAGPAESDPQKGQETGERAQ